MIRFWMEGGEKKECVFVSVSSVTEERQWRKLNVQKKSPQRKKTRDSDSCGMGRESWVSLRKWHNVNGICECVYVLDWYMITAFLLLGMWGKMGNAACFFALVREGNRRKKFNRESMEATAANREEVQCFPLSK